NTAAPANPLDLTPANVRDMLPGFLGNGYSFLAANDNTSSVQPTYVTLLNDHFITFTLAVATIVYIEYTAQIYNNTANGTNYTEIDVDGTALTQVAQGTGPAGGTALITLFIRVGTGTLAIGSHTVRMKHAVASGQTGNWFNRTLSARMF